MYSASLIVVGRTLLVLLRYHARPRPSFYFFPADFALYMAASARFIASSQAESLGGTAETPTLTDKVSDPSRSATSITEIAFRSFSAINKAAALSASGDGG